MNGRRDHHHGPPKAATREPRAPDARLRGGERHELIDERDGDVEVVALRIVGGQEETPERGPIGGPQGSSGASYAGVLGEDVARPAAERLGERCQRGEV